MPKYYFVDIIGKLNQTIFSGYIHVNEQDTITAFYEFSQCAEKENVWKNVLMAKNTSTAYPGADNKFPFSSSGVNFRSKNLKTYFGSRYNTFGLYNATPGSIDYRIWTMDENVTLQKYKIILSCVLIPPCFKRGTKLLALNKYRNEEYVPVEMITQGDMVKTYLHGFRRVTSISKLHIINKPENPRYVMYKMKKTEDDESVLIKDLLLMGEHSILVDKLSQEVEREEISCYGEVFDIDGKICNHCCLASDFHPIKETKMYECFKIELDDDGDYNKGFAIWANGLLVETPCHNEFTEDRLSLIHI